MTPPYAPAANSLTAKQQHPGGFDRPIPSSITGAVNQLQMLWRAHTASAPIGLDATAIASAVSIVSISSHASAFELQKYAWKRLAVVRGDGDAKPSQEAIESLHQVLLDFVGDDGPTPQVGSTPEGTVEVQWLAGGTLVSAIFENSGEYNLYAVAPDDAVLFDADIESGERPSVELREEMSNVLVRMARQVRVRPASWT